MSSHTKRKRDRSPSVHSQSSENSDYSEHPKRRTATVYDAVAGKVGSNGFIRDLSYGYQETILAPEEVLFKSTKAPERFQEDDYYWANRHLPPDCLPETDLLEAIHVFTSDYYHNTTLNSERIDFKSLDGSALLAIGILLEESARNVLGNTGDLAFVEGQPIETTEETVKGRMNLDRESESATPIKVTTSRSHDLSRNTKRQRRR